MSTVPVPVCHEYGDAALLVDLPGDDYPSRWSAAQALGTALRDSNLSGLVDVVASYENVFVSFDPLATDHIVVRAAVATLSGAAPANRPAREFLVPVVYGGAHGPDLAEVAAILSWSTDDLVAWHAATPWTIRFVGSPVGAPMLDGPRPPASVPRRTSPRARVEPGSVALSGLQSMIYNAPSPGGWQLVGRTPARLFDLARPPHVAYRAGDTLRLQPIDAADWATWEGRPPRQREQVAEGAR